MPGRGLFRRACCGDAEVVAAAIADGGAVDAALGSGYKHRRDTLLSSVDLTVQQIVWAPGMLSPPHEHRMWAVVGVYDGEERNRLYERVAAGLTERGCQDVARGEVFVLDTTAIHSVENLDGCERLDFMSMAGTS